MPVTVAATSAPGVSNNMPGDRKMRFNHESAPLLRRSGPNRPPGECVVVDLDIATCSTDEQLPPTPPAQLLERGVCTKCDWERWSASFAVRQARCQYLTGCVAWMFALLILPIVVVARRDRAYYEGDAQALCLIAAGSSKPRRADQ